MSDWVEVMRFLWGGGFYRTNARPLQPQRTPSAAAHTSAIRA